MMSTPKLPHSTSADRSTKRGIVTNAPNDPVLGLSTIHSPYIAHTRHGKWPKS